MRRVQKAAGKNPTQAVADPGIGGRKIIPPPPFPVPCPPFFLVSAAKRPRLKSSWVSGGALGSDRELPCESGRQTLSMHYE